MIDQQLVSSGSNGCRRKLRPMTGANQRRQCGESPLRRWVTPRAPSPVKWNSGGAVKGHRPDGLRPGLPVIGLTHQARYTRRGIQPMAAGDERLDTSRLAHGSGRCRYRPFESSRRRLGCSEAAIHPCRGEAVRAASVLRDLADGRASIRVPFALAA